MSISSSNLDYEKLREQFDYENLAIISFDQKLSETIPSLEKKWRACHPQGSFTQINGWDLLSGKNNQLLKNNKSKIYILAHGNILNTDWIRGKIENTNKFKFSHIMMADKPPIDIKDIPADTLVIIKEKEFGLNAITVYWVQDNQLMSGTQFEKKLEENIVQKLHSISVGQSSNDISLVDKLISEWVCANQRIRHEQLAETLATFIGNRHNVVVNLIICGGARGEDEKPHENFENSFAAKLHNNAQLNKDKDIPVVARTHIVITKTPEGEKYVASLDKSFSEIVTAYITGAEMEDKKKNRDQN